MTKEDLKLLFAAIVDGNYGIRLDHMPGYDWGLVNIYGVLDPGPSILISWGNNNIGEMTIVLRNDGEVIDIDLPIPELAQRLGEFL